MKHICYIIIISCFCFTANKLALAQFKLYEDTFNGGVTCAGWSPDYFVGGSGTMTVSIPAGSTIRKAYIMAGQHGSTGTATVMLNAIPCNFGPANIVGSTFSSIYACTPASVHAIDITASVSAATTVYNISFPTPPYCEHYQDFYLFIAYDNPSLPVVSVGLWTNTFNFGPSLNYTLNVVNPINTSNDVGLAMFAGYACSAGDGEVVIVNGTNVGTYYGDEYNSGSCSGAMGQFSYNSGVLTGIGDDNPNQAMAGPDALSNIKALIPMSTTSFPVQLNHASGNQDNSIWGVVLVYGASVTLPAHILDLKGSLDKEKNTFLEWNVNYDNAVSFELERSTDGGKTYQTVTEKIHTPANTVYHYTDKDGFAGSTLFYRIKCKEKDGRYTFSNIVEITPVLDSKVKNLFEQPVVLPKSLQYEYTSDKNTTILYQVYDISGRLVFNKEILADAGKQNISFDVPQLPQGLYYVNMLAEGRMLHQHKLVVM